LQTATHHSSEAREGATASYKFPPLETVTKPTVGTPAAAYYLDRSGQRLREWACYGNGPITPLRIGGRLAWRVADLKRLLGVA
jgi:hypothetical protein